MNELTTRELLRWGDLDERRRRQALRVGRLGWIARALVGAGLAALVAREADGNVIAASRLVLAAMVAMYAWVMLGAPFRMYWRVDSPLLARLPIPGQALFEVALVRSGRAAIGAAVVVAPAAAALAVASNDLAIRHLSILGAVAMAATLLLPSVALAAGALVAGGKASALFKAVGGTDVPAPPTAWLGMLPGLCAAAVVLVVIALAPWAAADSTSTIVGPPAVLVLGLHVASIFAAMVARRAAALVMPQAVREVAALDVQRLAHLEIDPPSRLERAVAARLGPRAALVHGKDARLMRRRFPMVLVAGAVTTLALWIVAGVRPAAAWVWVATITAAFCAYGALVAWRLASKPLELRVWNSLPLTRGDLVRAKTAWLGTWTLLYPLLGAAALAVRLPDGPLLAGFVLAIAAVSIVIGSRLIARAIS